MRASLVFAATTHLCGEDRDLLTLTLDGKVVYHRNAACGWNPTGAEVLTLGGTPLDLPAHHEIVWVGRMFGEPDTEGPDDVVVVRRSPARDPDEADVLFFEGRIEGTRYVLAARALAGPRSIVRTTCGSAGSTTTMRSI